MVGLSLAAVSVVCGILAVWVFRQTTDLAAAQRTVKRVQAHLLEFRLFYDEPRIVWRAQMAIVRENLRFFRLVGRPLIILTVPMAWLLVQLEAVYGYNPLAIGEPSVITAQVSEQFIAGDAGVALDAPAGIAVETPPVRSTADRQISWRIRPLRPVHGSLRLRLRGGAIEKSIAAGTRPIFLVRKRERSLWYFLVHPEEARLPAGDIASIEVDYPATDVVIIGIAMPWLAWFVVLSTLGALAFARWS